jgi:hypothetical protein
MRDNKYLNVILTINAVLLAAVLWLQFSGPQRAAAQTSGLPDAGAQRRQMIDSLGRIERSMAETRSLLEKGKVRVEVTNVSQLQ